MWAHEMNRVVHDRLLFDDDKTAFLNYVKTEVRKLGDIKEDAVYEEPLIYTNFVAICKGHEAAYKPVEDMEDLREVLEDKLAEYNENVAQMDLVLFDQAMEHITRISRIIYNPAGNALLVGVGGSGKQSLTKLTSFIHQFEIFRIVVATNYGVGDLKTDIQTLFTKAGV
jgi:dynein heavy chain